MTDVLAVRLLDDAAGSATLKEFSDRSREVTDLAQDLATFVGYLAAIIAKERAARDRWGREPSVGDPTVGP